jgi:hypothetical protein
MSGSTENPRHDGKDPEGVMSNQSRPVDCQQLVELLGEYVDNQLTAEQRVHVDYHMEQCAPCLAFLRQYKFAPQAVRDHLLQAVPVDLEDRLLSFLKKRTRG